MSYYVKRDDSDITLFDGDGNETNRIHEQELYKMYDDMLNDCSELIRIGTLEYLPSNVLKNVDEIAYRVGFDEYADSMGLDKE